MLLQLILIFVFGKAQQAFSVKSQIVNMFGFVHAMQFLPELLNSAIAVQKQPEAIRRWLSLVLFQQNFTYGYWNLNFV